MYPSSYALELLANVSIYLDHSHLYRCKYRLCSLSLGYTPWQEYDTSPQGEVFPLGELLVGLHDSSHSLCRLE